MKEYIIRLMAFWGLVFWAIAGAIYWLNQTADPTDFWPWEWYSWVLVAPWLAVIPVTVVAGVATIVLYFKNYAKV